MPKITLHQGDVTANLKEVAYNPAEGFQEEGSWHVVEESISAIPDAKLASGPATIHCGEATFSVSVTVFHQERTVEIACPDGLPKLALALGLLGHLSPKERKAILER